MRPERDVLARLVAGIQPGAREIERRRAIALAQRRVIAAVVFVFELGAAIVDREAGSDAIGKRAPRVAPPTRSPPESSEPLAMPNCGFTFSLPSSKLKSSPMPNSVHWSSPVLPHSSPNAGLVQKVP
jgi:hypothetical protein